MADVFFYPFMFPLPHPSPPQLALLYMRNVLDQVYVLASEKQEEFIHLE